MIDYLTAFFAQVAIDSTVIAQYGITGVVLLWFMLRFEKKMDKHTSVINDLVEAITLDVLSRESVHPGARARAEKILERTNYRSTTAKAHLPGPPCETA